MSELRNILKFPILLSSKNSNFESNENLKRIFGGIKLGFSVAAGRLLSSRPYRLFTEDGQKRTETHRRVKSPPPQDHPVSTADTGVKPGGSDNFQSFEMAAEDIKKSAISNILIPGEAENDVAAEVQDDYVSNYVDKNDHDNKYENYSMDHVQKFVEPVISSAGSACEIPEDNLSQFVTESLFNESQKSETKEQLTKNVKNFQDATPKSTKIESGEKTTILAKSTEPIVDNWTNSNSTTQNLTNQLSKKISPQTSGVKTVSVSSKIAKAGDKDFLKEFYGNSRLHHISTWGVQFKQLVKQFQSKPPADKINWDSYNSSSYNLDLSNINHRCKPYCWSPNFDSLGIEEPKVMLHVDMDCFFVSVSLLKHPELVGKPVAVTHSRGTGPLSTDENTGMSKTDISKSYAEIASCSYEARAFGVKNGMLMKHAILLCPDLKTIQYNFEEYHQTAVAMYNIVAKFSTTIQAVSCDECFVDITFCVKKSGLSPCEISMLISSEIFEKTKCHASVGISTNMLLCRLATKSAKPNGLFSIDSENQSNLYKHLDSLNVMDLPGVGFSCRSQLESLGIETVADLRYRELPELKSVLGAKTGEMLFNYSRGVDNRELNSVIKRKSVSSEINYGIRLNTMEEVVLFVEELTNEVHRRLLECEMVTKNICLKLRIRSADQPKETKKFLGCGICDTINKSKNLLSFTNNVDLLKREIAQILKVTKFEPSDLRGVGIAFNKLADETSNSSPSKFRDIAQMFSKSNKASMKCQRALSYSSKTNNINPSNSKQLSTTDASKNIANVVNKLKNQVEPNTKNDKLILRNDGTLWSKAAQKSGIYISPTEETDNDPCGSNLPTVPTTTGYQVLAEKDTIADSDEELHLESVEQKKKSPNVNMRLMQNQRSKFRSKLSKDVSKVVHYVAPENKRSVWNDNANKKSKVRNIHLRKDENEQRLERCFPSFGGASNIDEACQLLYCWISDEQSGKFKCLPKFDLIIVLWS